MRGPLFDGPVLHGIGNHIGNGGIKASAAADDVSQLLKNVAGKALAHGFQTEDVAAEFRYGALFRENGSGKGGKNGVAARFAHVILQMKHLRGNVCCLS